jgi:excisionase family DNA binding protein
MTTMNTNSPDPGRLLAELMRPMIREEIRAAVQELLAPREEPTTEWLDTKAAAHLLDVHPKTLERLARSGQIESARAGRCLRFHRDGLNRYLGGVR